MADSKHALFNGLHGSALMSYCARMLCAVIVCTLTFLGSHKTYAATKTHTWIGAGSPNDTWSVNANWSPTGPIDPGDTALFSGTFGGGGTATTILLDGNRTILSLEISTTTNFSINNDTLTLHDLTRSALSGTTTINSNINITGTPKESTWHIHGDLILNGILSTTSNNDLKKTGAGTLTLAGNNSTYDHLITVSEGILKAGNAGALGSTVEGTVVTGDGAALDLNGQTIGNETVTIHGTGVSLGGALINSSGTAASLSGGVILDNASSIGGSGDMTLSGALTGAFDLTKVGTGTVTLSGDNSAYVHLITISAGTLKAGSSTALGTNPQGTVVSSGGVLDLNGQTISSEAVTINGTGISSGGALINSSGTAASLSSGLTLGSASSIGGSGDMTLSGAITGAFDLTKVGAGTVILTADNSAYANAITVSAGTLQVGDGGATGTLGSGAVTNNAALVFKRDASANSTVGNAISGTGSLTQDGANAVILTNTSTYTGATNVNSGSLVVNGALTGGDDFTVNSGAVLAGTGDIATAADKSIFINGTLNIGDPTVVAVASTFSLTTSGTGSTVLGAGSFIHLNLFTGAGLGDNTAITTAADVLNLHGTLNASAGGTLVIDNPNGLTAFAVGDKWKLIELNTGGPNAGNIISKLALNDSSLALASGLSGSFDETTGIYTIGTNWQYDARVSAQTSGLSMANAEGQALIMGGNTVTGDVNNHLFNLRAGDGEEAANDSLAAALDDGVIVGQGDGDPKSPIARRAPRSRQWEVFTTVNYGNAKLGAIGSQSGVQIDSWAPSVGIERHLSRGLALGFAVSFLHSEQNYTAGLGRVELEGPALSAYISFVRKSFWSSLLYSFGTYDMSSTRNPGFGFATALGSTHTNTNAIQYNTGWNFRFQNNTLVTGPFAGIDWLYGTVAGYSETGGGLAALSYGTQTYQSLVTRVGWTVSKKFTTDWAVITPQVRVSYERQNLTNNGTSVNLINAPFTATGGNQSPGQDYVVIGTGVNFQFTPDFGMLLGYQTQLFRNNMEAHFGSVRFSYKF